MNNIEKQIEELKQQIESLKQELQNKQILLNGLLNKLLEGESEDEEKF